MHSLPKILVQLYAVLLTNVHFAITFPPLKTLLANNWNQMCIYNT